MGRQDIYYLALSIMLTSTPHYIAPSVYPADAGCFRFTVESERLSLGEPFEFVVYRMVPEWRPHDSYSLSEIYSHANRQLPLDNWSVTLHRVCTHSRFVNSVLLSYMRVTNPRPHLVALIAAKLGNVEDVAYVMYNIRINGFMPLTGHLDWMPVCRLTSGFTIPNCEPFVGPPTSSAKAKTSVIMLID
jgi:hypothetical protein